MKIRAWQLGLIIILIGGLIFAYIDLTYLPETEILQSGWWGFGFGVGTVAPLVGIALGLYYFVRYFVNKNKKKSKSYI